MFKTFYIYRLQDNYRPNHKINLDMIYRKIGRAVTDWSFDKSHGVSDILNFSKRQLGPILGSIQFSPLDIPFHSSKRNT